MTFFHLASTARRKKEQVKRSLACTGGGKTTWFLTPDGHTESWPKGLSRLHHLTSDGRMKSHLRIGANGRLLSLESGHDEAAIVSRSTSISEDKGRLKR